MAPIASSPPTIGTRVLCSWIGLERCPIPFTPCSGLSDQIFYRRHIPSSLSFFVKNKAYTKRGFCDPP
jgi:hypothetical protein